MSNDRKTLRELREIYTYGEIVRGEHLDEDSAAIDHPQFQKTETQAAKAPQPKIH